jgi:hypothetical protein
MSPAVFLCAVHVNTAGRAFDWFRFYVVDFARRKFEAATILESEVSRNLTTEQAHHRLANREIERLKRELQAIQASSELEIAKLQQELTAAQEASRTVVSVSAVIPMIATEGMVCSRCQGLPSTTAVISQDSITATSVGSSFNYMADGMGLEATKPRLSTVSVSTQYEVEMEMVLEAIDFAPRSVAPVPPPPTLSSSSLLEEMNSRLNEEVSQLNAELSALRAHMSEQIIVYQQEVEKLLTEASRASSSHSSQLHALQQQFDATVSDHVENTRILVAEWTGKLESAVAAHEKHQCELIFAHTHALETCQAEHATAMAAATTRHAQEITASLQSGAQALKQQFDSLSNTHDAAMQTLRTRHTEAQADWQREKDEFTSRVTALTTQVADGSALLRTHTQNAEIATGALQAAHTVQLRDVEQKWMLMQQSLESLHSTRLQAVVDELATVRELHQRQTTEQEARQDQIKDQLTAKETQLAILTQTTTDQLRQSEHTHQQMTARLVSIEATLLQRDQTIVTKETDFVALQVRIIRFSVCEGVKYV